MPGMTPVSRSSRLGVVAAVIETVSPSQLRPLVSQRTWISWASVRRCCGANSRDGIGAFEPRLPDAFLGVDEGLGGSLHEMPEVVLDAAVQVQVVGAAGDEAGARQARHRVR